LCKAEHFNGLDSFRVLKGVENKAGGNERQEKYTHVKNMDVHFVTPFFFSLVLSEKLIKKRA
jgi:hypothetical protein